MKKTFTPQISGLYFLAVFAMVFQFSCTARVEREKDEQHATKVPATVKEKKAVTVAAIEAPANEAYFDLIVETTGCLGENLWIGGKVESTEKMALGKTGDISEAKVYEVKEITATGIESNYIYTLSGEPDMLKAVVNKDNGAVYIQLSEGQLQLLPKEDSAPITVAYNPTTANGYLDGMIGSWNCK